MSEYDHKITCGSIVQNIKNNTKTSVRKYYLKLTDNFHVMRWQTTGSLAHRHPKPEKMWMRLPSKYPDPRLWASGTLTHLTNHSNISMLLCHDDILCERGTRFEPDSSI